MNTVRFHRHSRTCELQYLRVGAAFKWRNLLFVRADYCGEEKDKVFCICLSHLEELRTVSRFAQVVPCALSITATETEVVM